MPSLYMQTAERDAQQEGRASVMGPQSSRETAGPDVLRMRFGTWRAVLR
jgi:hypothetical protein